MATAMETTSELASPESQLPSRLIVLYRMQTILPLSSDPPPPPCPT